MNAIKLSAIGLSAIAILATVLALGSIDARERVRLGLRGHKRADALRHSYVWRNSEPFIRWLGGCLSRSVDELGGRHVDRVLERAGDPLGLGAEEFIAIVISSTLIGLAVGIGAHFILDRGAIWVIASPILGLVIPIATLRNTTERRVHEIHAGLPWVIDLVALSLSGGMDFTGALAQVIDKRSNRNDPLAEEMSLILRELQVGKTRKFALLQLAERVPTAPVKEFVFAVVQAEERGNPLGPVLETQAEVSRQRRSDLAEDKAAKASVQMMMPLMLLLVAVLLLVVAPLMIKLTPILRG